MITKLFAILAALLLAMNGCAPAATQPSGTTTTKPPVTTQTSTTQVPTTQAPTTVPGFQELTLVDNEHCAVIVKGIEENSLLGYALNIFLENKTDLELMFSVDQVSVNGFMIDPFWATAVSAGKKSNSQITFFESDFEANGINQVSEITFTLNVYDNNDWLADRLVQQEFTINL
jgi:hypothetical protein